MAEPGRREDPFGLLGLPARAGLTDEDVRAAWRRIAAATHPDREDGGDPAVFGAAAAAYVTVRTSYGRGEALADLADATVTVSAGRPGGRRRRVVRPRAAAGSALAGRAARLAASRRGWGLAARALVAAAACAAAFLAAGWSPGTAGVLAGVLSWLLVTRALSRGGAGVRAVTWGRGRWRRGGTGR